MSSVSVIVPTFNRRARLGEALASVLAQTRAADELLVVDDGSDDGTAAWVADRYPQVRLIRSEHNRGVSAARNRGIREAQGEWVALLDSDDHWQPDKLRRQMQCARENPEARIIHTDEIWIRNGRRVNPMKKHAKRGGWIFRHCLPLCAISPSAVMIHRQVFHEVGLFDETLPACEDYDLWLRITARFPVHYIDEPLVVKTGGHDDQLSRRYPAMDRFRIAALDRIIRSGQLNAGDEAAAHRVLADKLRIYLAGAAKRGRHEELQRCGALWRTYLPGVEMPAP